MSLEVDADDRVPVRLGQVEAHAVAQDPRVVDEDVELAERLDRLSDERLGARPRRDVVVVGDGFTAPGLDFLHNGIGHGRAAAGPVTGSSQIIDDHLGPPFRQLQCIGLPETAACTGHQTLN